jgi:hypothetical protein
VDVRVNEMVITAGLLDAIRISCEQENKTAVGCMIWSVLLVFYRTEYHNSYFGKHQRVIWKVADSTETREWKRFFVNCVRKQEFGLYGGRIVQVAPKWEECK